MKPVGTFIRLTLALVAIDALVMVALWFLDIRNARLELLVNAGLLLLVAAPLLYVWLARGTRETTSREEGFRETVREHQEAPDGPG